MKIPMLPALFLPLLALNAPPAFSDDTTSASVISADHPFIQIIGRHDDTDPARPRLSFSGATVRASFESESITLLLKDEARGDLAHMNVYTVLINGTPVRPLIPVRDTTRYVLASGLGEGTHTVEVRKRTEGTVGSSLFLGFELSEGGKIVEPPPRSERRIEFIGDSITCGYGIMVEGDPPITTFLSTNQNHDLAYGSLTAMILGAESHTVVVSGRGLYRDVDGKVSAQIPAIYSRSVATDSATRWAHSRWSPHVIVINLGTNDFSKPRLRDHEFRSAYDAFVGRLRGFHPEAQIICCLGPMMHDNWPEGENSLTRAREIVSGIVNQRNEQGDARIHFHEFELQKPPYGENWHPSRATHLEMAQTLAGRIAAIMEWNSALE